MRRQTYGYLPSRRASLPLDWYLIILLGDRGICVQTICPRLLPESRTASRSRLQAVQKWLNQWRLCGLLERWADLRGIKGPCIRWDVHWHNLANATEWSTHSSDAALYQITLTSCSFNKFINYLLNTTATATVLWPLNRSTCVSRHLQLRTGGLYWCKVYWPRALADGNYFW